MHRARRTRDQRGALAIEFLLVIGVLVVVWRGRLLLPQLPARKLGDQDELALGRAQAEVQRSRLVAVAVVAVDVVDGS